MAKITDYMFDINQERVKVGIYYTRSKGFYAKNVPGDVLALQEYHPFFDKEDDLRLFLVKAIAHYHEIIKKSRKVIAYKISMTTELCMNKESEGHYCGYKPWIPKNYSHLNKIDGINSGYGFIIRWKLLMEMSAEDIKYYRIHDDGSVGNKTYTGPQYQIIEWTPEREAAFKEIDASLEGMVKKITAVLCDKEKVKYLLDNQIKLLGGYGNDRIA